MKWVTRERPSSSEATKFQMIQRLLAALVLCLLSAAAAGAATSPLVLEATIALPDTSGRIDHLDIDLARKRLFVVELGNGSVDVIDLASRNVIHRIAGLDEPQGVVYVPKSDLLVIACGGDGTVRIFAGSDFAPRGIVQLGDDADNARLDSDGNVVVGYGSGGLAVIDPVKAARIRDIPLPAHPEAFQLAGGRVYVNVPDAHQIDVADLGSGKVIAKWSTPSLSSNFSMAIGGNGRVAVAFRSPARLALFDPMTGQIASVAETCADADDVFDDAKRQRYLVSCGAGAIDVFEATGGKLSLVARMPTTSGARTSLFVPALDRLFLAVRAGLIFGSNASIQIFRPVP
ncbi:MAG TPA: hypothetical protein VII56_04715 [Rhizomicrobium sp.]